MLGWKYEPLKITSMRRSRTMDSKPCHIRQWYWSCAPSTSVWWGRLHVAVEHGIITEKRHPPNPVNESGIFTSEVGDFAGRDVKAADRAIIKYLKKRKRLVVGSQITRSYPLCWWSDTPLIYRARVLGSGTSPGIDTGVPRPIWMIVVTTAPHCTSMQLGRVGGRKFPSLWSSEDC